MNQIDGYHEITIVGTGELFLCRTEEAVLRALARTGKKGIPVGCRSGGCGVCKVHVVAGTYHKRKMSRAHVSEADEAEGIVLSCCIFPESDLKVDVIGKLRNAAKKVESIK